MVYQLKPGAASEFKNLEIDYNNKMFIDFVRVTLSRVYKERFSRDVISLEFYKNN